MQNEQQKSIVLVGLPGARKQMVGRSLAERLGYYYIDDLPNDYGTEFNRFRNVFVPEDIRFFDSVTIESFKKKSLMIFLDMPVTVEEYYQKTEKMHQLYYSSRNFYEGCSHTTVICQKTEFDASLTAELIEKVFNKIKKGKIEIKVV